MNTKGLSIKADNELRFMIFHGLNEAIDKNKMDNEILKELLNWYKDNVITSYDYLKEKFDNL